MNPQEKNWRSLCATCGREVSNTSYFAGPKGSSHFKGTCRVPTWEKERELVRQTLKPWKPCFSFADTPGIPEIQTFADLCKWWGLPSIGEASKPKGKGKEALAKMGLAA